MQTNIAEFLHRTLSSMGYEGQRFEFDANSTIEITLKNIPSLFISVINERIWLWSRLSWMNSNTLVDRGSELWFELQEALPSVVTGQPVLGRGCDGYELKALMDENCFQQEKELEKLLESFFLLCTRLQARCS
ncbi:type III secretion apparatus InvB [Serratia proteamaculans]|uniref:InvB/SpaK family type III secretion system chaperone n=1 Tax=Serratia proteamaculans TaxID=28151 RepID=UPI001075DA37|nr:type III secretion apparatus InvB [Serratia proteamaculans]TFZ49377.1 type III secretion apparatus InvB [Serratia proteamaculans]